MPEVEDVVNTRPPVFSYYEFVITWSCLLENKHMSFHKLELKNFQTQAFSKQWLEHSPGWEWCKCVCGAGFCVCMSVCICVCVYVCIHVPMQGHVAELTKLNSCSRWTVWINKCCAWLDCSFSNLSPFPPFLPPSLPSPLCSHFPPSFCPWLHGGQVIGWLFAFRSLLSDLAVEQIRSCLKVKKLKSPQFPPGSLSVG